MTFAVGQLAELSGVPATTLRYYDTVGLLVAERLPNGHRRYAREALERLDLIRVARSLGLTLDEIAGVLGSAGAERRALARRKLAELDATVARLSAIRAVLEHFAHCQHSPAHADQCAGTVQRIWVALRPENV